VLQVFEMGGQIQAKGSLHEPTLTYHFGLDLVAIAQVQILHFFTCQFYVVSKAQHKASLLRIMSNFP
jgi:hypothetical protein